MKTLDIFGVIGDEWDGLHSGQIARELDGHTGDLLVRINSPGGFAYEGVAIYNLLKDHNPRVEVVGLAASAASIIAMAGSEIHMRTGAEMMIHDAWGIAAGNANEFRAYAEHLDKLSGSIADIYGRRTGDRDSARSAMAAETWYSAAEAVDAKLATHLESDAAEPEPENARAVLAAMNAVARGGATEKDIEAAEALLSKARRYRAKASLSRVRNLT